ncbi:MAG: C40 family peptidase [Alicyclobacillus sp.]|nr:C40 family peptidase [Alicyclobacillus sp.]
MRVKPLVGRIVASALACLAAVPSSAYAATHKVQSGESLWSLSERYHVSVSTLEQVNHLHTTTLYIGQMLQIPSGSSSASRPASAPKQTGTVVVTLREGQTIWSLAQDYGVSVQSILNANGLTAHSVVMVGEKVKVPRGSAPSLSGRSESSINTVLADALLGQNIVAYAKQFEGSPYRWGGESPSGFDCSGYVQFVLGHFGISVGRTSYSQAQAGTAVSLNDLQPGDLVFFDTDGSGASHSGIYIGAGEFINAEDRGVRIDSISGYWASHYVGARRVI